MRGFVTARWTAGGTAPSPSPSPCFELRLMRSNTTRSIVNKLPSTSPRHIHPTGDRFPVLGTRIYSSQNNSRWKRTLVIGQNPFPLTITSFTKLPKDSTTLFLEDTHVIKGHVLPFPRRRFGFLAPSAGQFGGKLRVGFCVVIREVFRR
jgi:hypothetical protein